MPIASLDYSTRIIVVITGPGGHCRKTNCILTRKFMFSMKHLQLWKLWQTLPNMELRKISDCEIEII